MSDQLTDEQVALFRKVYYSLTKDDISPMPNTNLGLCLRTLGYYPSQIDLDNLVKEWDQEGMGWIEYKAYLNMMAKKVKEPVLSEETVMSAFRVFDKKGNGFVSAAEMRYVLAGTGEPFLDGEAEEFFKYAAPDEDGQINYIDFVTRYMAKKKL